MALAVPPRQESSYEVWRLGQDQVRILDARRADYVAHEELHALRLRLPLAEQRCLCGGGRKWVGRRGEADERTGEFMSWATHANAQV